MRWLTDSCQRLGFWEVISPEDIAFLDLCRFVPIAEVIEAKGHSLRRVYLTAIDSNSYDVQEDEGDADGNGFISGPVDFVPIGEISV